MSSRRATLETSSGHTTAAPEPGAEPSALALIHDVLGGEVIAAEGTRRPDQVAGRRIPAIGDDPDGRPRRMTAAVHEAAPRRRPTT